MKKLTTEEIIKRFREIHGNRYIYDLVVYNGMNKDVLIICPIHGIFKQKPCKHLRGHGCPKCNCGRQFTTETYKEEATRVHNGLYAYNDLVFTGMGNNIIATCKIHGNFKQKASYHLKGGGCPICAGCKRSNIEEFIEKARKVHGDKYDYSKVVYVNNRTPVCIICPIHGEFWQTPNTHLHGGGCPKCSGNVNFTQEEYVEKCDKVHNGYYDNSEIIFKRTADYVTPICPIHGKFMIRADHYLHGHGCKQCNGGGTITNEEYKRRMVQKYGDLYDLSKTEYNGATNKVILICKIHGEFEAVATSILQGHSGCPECTKIRLRETNRTPFEEVLEISNKVHNNKYIYHEDSYKKVGDYFRVTCPIHGDFEQIVYEHMHGCGCPSCGIGSSKAEKNITQYLTDNGIECKVKTRKLLDGFEMDIFIPKFNIGVEYDGLWWHSEKQEKDKGYHIGKTELANSKGYKLIHIFEDEYMFHKDLVLDKLNEIFGIKTDKISLNNVIIKEVNDIKDFIDKFQLTPFIKSDINYGAYFNDTLIGVLSFKREGLGRWRITNMAFNLHYNTNGLFKEMFNKYVSDYNPVEVVCISDRRWEISHDNNIFTEIGFILDEILPPDYYYIVSLKRVHHSEIDADFIKEKYELTESVDKDRLFENGILNRIWDCGAFKYKWINKK